MIASSIVVDSPSGGYPNVCQQEMSFAVDGEITGDRLIDCSRRSAARDTVRCRLMDHRRSSSPLALMVSLDVPREITGTLARDQRQSSPQLSSLSIDRSLSIVPSIVSLFSPSIPNVWQRKRSLAVD